jgi:hypothetical protein
MLNAIRPGVGAIYCLIARGFLLPADVNICGAGAVYRHLVACTGTWVGIHSYRGPAIASNFCATRSARACPRT